MMLPPLLIIVIALGVVFGGLAMLWLAEQIPIAPDGTRQSSVALLRLTGWLLLLLGFLGGMAAALNVFSILLWIVTLAILLTSLGRYYSAERESLLWVLTIACEKGIPLADAARAFAAERNDRVARSAIRLADYLDAGVPLGLAAARSRIYLPPAARLALDVGPETGGLGPALRQLVGRSEDREYLIRSVLAKLLYLAIVLFYTSALVTFLVIKIFPVIQKMFSEFDLRLPRATEALLYLTDHLSSSLILLPPVLIWIVVVIVALVGYARASVPNLPGLRWLQGISDQATILRWLAVAVRQGRPIGETLRLLAVHFPVASTQRRLESASQRVDRGIDWNESLLAAGLIRRSESVLIRSAERVGNLPWAMEEMADSGVRRATYRMQAIVDLGFVAILLAAGPLVLAITAGILLPLISLIQALS